MPKYTVDFTTETGSFENIGSFKLVRVLGQGFQRGSQMIWDDPIPYLSGPGSINSG